VIKKIGKKRKWIPVRVTLSVLPEVAEMLKVGDVDVNDDGIVTSRIVSIISQKPYVDVNSERIDLRYLFDFFAKKVDVLMSIKCVKRPDLCYHNNSPVVLGQRLYFFSRKYVMWGTVTSLSF